MAPGAKDWQPSSFSPRTGLVYIPHENMCMDEEVQRPTTSRARLTLELRCATTRARRQHGRAAWHGIRSRAKKVWTITDKYPIWSGTVATAGDLVFFGTMDGWFKAADARTGKILWQFKTRLRHYRAADHLSRSGRQAVRRDPLRSRRLARLDRLGNNSTRATARRPTAGARRSRTFAMK